MREDLSKFIYEHNARDNTEEYGCVNALQRTPWRVNKPLLNTLRAAWDSNQQWAGLPARENTPIPKYPFANDPADLTEEQRLEFRRFKSLRGAIYSDNAKNLSRRIQVERTLQLAEEYADIEEFWYVWQCDFRGRKYPVESFLSPQNADYSKALLEFATPVAINSEGDARWLAIHGANLFGVDKVSLDDRELWAYMNKDMAVQVAANPLDVLWWTEADKPWQALAWCFEWAGLVKAKERGEPFYTRLPCASDGSCNGLQHLSAMLRDVEGGKAVNLTPSTQPRDIYSDVASRTEELLRAENTELADQLLSVGVCRKICKRPVMIVPYSGTRHSCKDYIREALEEKCGSSAPWGDDFFGASLYLSGFVWSAISDVIVSAFKVMDYIKELAKLYVDNDTVFSWATPTGLVVRQDYKQVRKRKVKSHISGSIIQLTYNEALEDTIDRRKVLSGASPNFVHSMDAAALTMTVSKCLEDGITDFAMVHDSYGTHSPNMPRLNKHLRQAFVDMYETNDVLWNLYEAAICTLPDNVVVPPPPARGELDLQEVLKSDYFFA